MQKNILCCQRIKKQKEKKYKKKRKNRKPNRRNVKRKKRENLEKLKKKIIHKQKYSLMSNKSKKFFRRRFSR